MFVFTERKLWNENVRGGGDRHGCATEYEVLSQLIHEDYFLLPYHTPRPTSLLQFCNIP